MPRSPIQLRLALILIVLGVWNSWVVFGMAQEPSSIDFQRDVLPIFEKHCTACHGAAKQTSDLRLDLRAAILKGSGSGEILKVGDASQSRVIEVVTGADPDYQMPPEGEKLSDAEVDILRKWIDQGATGPDDSAELQKKLPWSFQPVARPDSPKGAAGVDYWLNQQLTEKGLSFSEKADRHTLIRRLYLIALGIPPSTAEIAEFVGDQDPNAYERLVDRVLADRRYGERMARHWFDVVRFAESNGFETNRVRYNAWPYRDYVIEAFNSDKPYDVFVTEQIIGDALGVDAATGFLVAGTYDIVKSPDLNLTLMQRQDELADLINTTGTTFLGLTLGCARCHDHKFDPVTQYDFYSLQATFAGVNFGERVLRRPTSRESEQEVAKLRATVAQVTLELENLKREALAKVEKNGLRPAVNATINEEKFQPVSALAVRFTISQSGGSQPCVDEWEVFDERNENVALASKGSKATASSALPGYAIHKIEHINDGRDGNDFSWISNESNSGWIQIEFPQPMKIERMIWGRDRSGRFKDRVASVYRIEAKLKDGSWQEIASSKDRRPFSPDDTSALADLLEPAGKERYQALVKQQQEIQARINALTSGETAWLGTFSQPGEVHRLYRGDPLMKREVVMPGAVAALGAKSLSGDAAEQVRREELVNWLVDRKNPLTPRVIVNRLWHYTFGTGIVDTPSDFGGNGSKPLHPELLDWLASELLENGWSLKYVHRLLFLSQAFQQSSQPRADALAVDSEARLLWRFPPRRLEAEAIRDSMLVATGVMDWKMGGPGFYLQRVEQDNVYRYFPKEEVGPAEYRRMVYLTRIRQEQDPVFGAFDCPSGNQVTPRRSRSNTPLQALNLFNSPFVLQQADLLANRLQREAGDDVVQQVQVCFRVLLGRDADDYEVQLSRELIKSEGLVPFCRAMLNSSEFLFVF